MDALVKWTGCQMRNRHGILALLPSDIGRYYEPFVGGGSLFMGMPDCEQFFINDNCPELMALYAKAASGTKLFLSHLKDINFAWKELESAFEECKEGLVDLYRRYPEGGQYHYYDYTEDLNREIKKVDFARIFPQRYTSEGEFEMEKRFQFSRMKSRSKSLTFKTGEMLENHILTSLKMAFYSYFIELYNSKTPLAADLGSAILYFLLEFSTCGQFTRDRNGEFRPVYAGAAHNGQTLRGKISQMNAPQFKERMKKTKLYNEDFRSFLRKRKPQEDDFLMIDPPMGRMCRSVGCRSFSDKDMHELLVYLNKCKGRWMLLLRPGEMLLGCEKFMAGHQVHEIGVQRKTIVVTNY